MSSQQIRRVLNQGIEDNTREDRAQEETDQVKEKAQELGNSFSAGWKT
jgi:hypothetical protein